MNNLYTNVVTLEEYRGFDVATRDTYEKHIIMPQYIFLNRNVHNPSLNKRRRTVIAARIVQLALQLFQTLSLDTALLNNIKTIPTTLVQLITPNINANYMEYIGINMDKLRIMVRGLESGNMNIHSPFYDEVYA